MKIAVVSHDTFWPVRGAGSLRVFHVVKEMLRRGHRVSVVAPFLHRAGLDAALPGLRVMDAGKIARFTHRGRSKEFVFAKFAVRAAALAMRAPCDALYAHNSIAALAALPGARAHRIPFTFDMDDIISGLSSSRLASWLGPHVEMALARRATRLITMCRAMASVLESRGVRVTAMVRHGVELDLFDPARFADGPKEDLVAYSGGIEPHDGAVLIPAAAEIVAKRFPSAKFHIAGEGGGLAAVEEEVVRRGLSERFTFSGWLGHEEVPAFLARAKVGLVTHLRCLATEVAMVVKALEYMAMNVVPVVSDLPGLMEEVGGGERGKVFKAGDPAALAESICALLGDETLRLKLAERGLSFIRSECDWEANAGAIVDVCEGKRG